MNQEPPLISVQDLCLSFSSGKKEIKAVNHVSFSIREGETLGLVGESGSGKSSVAKSLLRLYEPDKGKIFYRGLNLCNLSQKELRPYRKEMQIIFQDNYASLNPRMTVEEIITEPLRIHYPKLSKQERHRILHTLLDQVGLCSYHSSFFPHELSGGQRQRVSIAKALSLKPKFIICDEPTAALDVSIQAQIINLLQDLQKEHRLTYLFISHDLAMVRYLCNEIAVMYFGEIVEIRPSEELISSPKHPYTKALLDSIPVPNPLGTLEPMQLKEEEESPLILDPVGCNFSARCPSATPLCQRKKPILTPSSIGSFVRCFKNEYSKENNE